MLEPGPHLLLAGIGLLIAVEVLIGRFMPSSGEVSDSAHRVVSWSSYIPALVILACWLPQRTWVSSCGDDRILILAVGSFYSAMMGLCCGICLRRRLIDPAVRHIGIGIVVAAFPFIGVWLIHRP